MVLGVDDAEVDPSITDQPVAVSGFGDADALAGQGLADEDGPATPLDLAAGPHATHGMTGVVPGLGQRLVGPLEVVVMAKGIEAGLLFLGVGRRRTGRRLLQGSVEALMAPVLPKNSP